MKHYTQLQYIFRIYMPNIILQVYEHNIYEVLFYVGDLNKYRNVHRAILNDTMHTSKKIQIYLSISFKNICTLITHKTITVAKFRAVYSENWTM